jgi:hypothetical protein
MLPTNQKNQNMWSNWSTLFAGITTEHFKVRIFLFGLHLFKFSNNIFAFLLKNIFQLCRCLPDVLFRICKICSFSLLDIVSGQVFNLI